MDEPACSTCEGTGEIHQEGQIGAPGSGGDIPCPDCVAKVQHNPCPPGCLIHRGGDIESTKPTSLYDALGLTPEQVAEHEEQLTADFARIRESERRAAIDSRNVLIGSVGDTEPTKPTERKPCPCTIPGPLGHGCANYASDDGGVCERCADGTYHGVGGTEPEPGCNCDEAETGIHRLGGPLGDCSVWRSGSAPTEPTPEAS